MGSFEPRDKANYETSDTHRADANRWDPPFSFVVDEDLINGMGKKWKLQCRGFSHSISLVPNISILHPPPPTKTFSVLILLR